MPDSKITALASIGTGTDPVNDALVIVDVSDVSPGGMSATGTTKRVSLNNLLASSPSATLASATITGDLTVRTNKLFVNATGVGIGTTTVNGDLTIQNGSNCRMEVSSSATGIVIENLNNARNAYLNMTMYADAYIWNRLGTTAMTLNSTGLGVGGAPVTGGKLTVAGPIVRNKGNATLTQNVATTVATLPGEGLFIAYAYTNASNPSAFTSYAVILCDSVGSRVIANNGTQISITTSTFALQVTQIFAATLGVSWSFVQIG